MQSPSTPSELRLALSPAWLQKGATFVEAKVVDGAPLASDTP